MNTVIFSWVTFIYFGSFFLYVLKIVLSRRYFFVAGFTLACAGFIAHSAGLIIRWVESYNLGIGHAPLSNFYESLVFFAWAIVLFYLVFELRKTIRNLGVFCLLLSFILMAYASFSPNISSQIKPLIPALKSNWLISHVITCFLGYAAFIIASIFSAVFLLKGTGSNSLLPDNRIEERIYQSLVIGFIFFTIGIMTGSVWANSAWGRYWGWDPKETWALITWLIYAAALHARHVPKWSAKKVAILVLIGCVSVLFTYFGVNYLPGLHSYM
jgi:ABC-type transport system involved in cytochrome c biogenesis permease subunit